MMFQPVPFFHLENCESLAEERRGSRLAWIGCWPLEGHHHHNNDNYHHHHQPRHHYSGAELQVMELLQYTGVLRCWCFREVLTSR